MIKKNQKVILTTIALCLLSAGIFLAYLVLIGIPRTQEQVKFLETSKSQNN